MKRHAFDLFVAYSNKVFGVFFTNFQMLLMPGTYWPLALGDRGWD